MFSLKYCFFNQLLYVLQDEPKVLKTHPLSSTQMSNFSYTIMIIDMIINI
ncbi:uncharacterized protein DS421_18g622100 [Arachis hypogaea]|nr:uncharacterized protein DS421_18g622100 [Arachis hypogaea]